MLDWSNVKYKMTLGVGSLAMVGAMADLSHSTMPFWIVLVVGLVPLALFVLFRRDELPVRVVAIAHVSAALWYMLTALVLLIGLVAQQASLHALLIYTPFLLPGMWPCVVVLNRAVNRGYVDEQF